jgi:hypothetical protein
MKFEQTMNKVFTNTYVLYGLFGYSVVTILGYLFAQNFDAIVVFALVGIIAKNFSRNMAVVMLICLTTVHLLLPNFKLMTRVHEGLKSMGKDTTTDETTTDTTTDTTTTDETSTSTTDEDKKKMMMMKKMSGSSGSTSSTGSGSKPTTTTDSSVESSRDTTAGFRPMEEKEGRDKLNYGASIHSAYQDLNSILDGDAIKNLTSETMALMEEQKKLSESLSSMGPFMEQAQNLLSNFNKNKK